MIGLLGAKIWIENQVDFANPINLVPIGAGIILAIGPVSHQVTDDFSLDGIALGTVVLLAGYHLLRSLAPAYMRDALVAGKPFGQEGAAVGAETHRRHGAHAAGVTSDHGAPPSPKHGQDTPEPRQ
jgi:hypothetical protein